MYWQRIHPELHAAAQSAKRRDGSAVDVIVHLCGELDMASSPSVERYLRELPGSATGLQLDLSRIGFFDASALRVVEEVIRVRQDEGSPITIRHPSQAVCRVFEVCRCDALGELCTTPSPPEVTGGIARVLEAALSEGCEAVGVGMATAQLADRAGILHLVAHPGFGDDFAGFFHYVEEDGDSACGVASRRHSAVWVGSVEASPIFRGKPSQAVMLEAGANAVGSVPIALPESPLLGVMSVHDERSRDWRAREQQHLVELGRATALALTELSLTSTGHQER